MKDFDMLNSLYNEEVLGLKKPTMEGAMKKAEPKDQIKILKESLKSLDKKDKNYDKKKTSIENKIKKIEDMIKELKGREKQVAVVKRERKKMEMSEACSTKKKPVKKKIINESIQEKKELQDELTKTIKKLAECNTDKSKKELNIDLIKKLMKKKKELEAKLKNLAKPTNEEVYTESALAESIKIGNYENIAQELIDMIKTLGDRGLTQSMAGVSITQGVLADKDLAFLWNKTITQPQKYFKSLINKLRLLAKGRQGEKQGEGWADE